MATCAALALVLFGAADLVLGQRPLASPAPATEASSGGLVELERVLVNQLARHAVRLQALEARADEQASEIVSLRDLLKSKILPVPQLMQAESTKDTLTSRLRPVQARTANEGAAVIYALTFTADVMPGIAWRQNGKPVFPSDPADPVTSIFNGTSGKTTFRTLDSDARISVTLSDGVKAFAVTFSTTRFATGEQEVGTCKLDVNPGGDFLYKPGENVTLSVPITGSDAAVGWRLWALDSSTSPPSLQTLSSQSQADVATESPVTMVPGAVTLTPGSRATQGVLEVACSLQASSLAAPVLLMTESHFTAFRPQGRQHTFPEAFLAPQETAGHQQTECQEGRACTLSCGVVGGGPPKMTLHQEDQAGQRQLLELPQVTLTQGPGRHLVLFNIQSYLPSLHEGDYVCSATRGAAVSESRLTVITVEDVKILPSSGVGQDAQKHRVVTCTATARPRPTVTLHENFAFGPLVARGDNYQVEELLPTAPGTATVRVTLLQPRPGVSTLSCVAHTPQGLATRDFPLLLSPTTPSWEFPPLGPPLRPAPAPMLSQGVL